MGRPYSGTVSSFEARGRHVYDRLLVCTQGGGGLQALDMSRRALQLPPQQQEPAFDLSQLAGSLTDYRFITMKHFSWWARQVETSRQIRHKARLVRQLVSRNNMRASVRAWAMHCGTLRHRRAKHV